PDEPCSQQKMLEWAMRPLVDRGVLATGEPTPETVETLIRQGVLLGEGEYATELEAPATRGHVALLMAGLIRLTEAAKESEGARPDTSLPRTP
ncbi:MAG: hypothetical protein ACUVX8_15210, partial [Candidatus Zipacnadales bacterium]